MQEYKKIKSQQNIEKQNERKEKRIMDMIEMQKQKQSLDLLKQGQLGLKKKNTELLDRTKSGKQIINNNNNTNSQKLQQYKLSQQSNSINNNNYISQNQLLNTQSTNVSPIIITTKKTSNEIVKPYMNKYNNNNVGVKSLNQMETISNIKIDSSKDITNYLKENLINHYKKEQSNIVKSKKDNQLKSMQQQKSILSKSTESTEDNTKQNAFDKDIIVLTDEETKLYGSRCPEGYSKINILGKGGFSIVWLCQNIKTQQKVAIKQILNKKNQESVQRELSFLYNFYTEEGQPKSKFISDKRLNNIIGLIEIQKDQKDTWIVYELGGITMSKLFYSMKGDFHNNERVYKITFSSTYYKFLQLNQNNMWKEFIYRNAIALSLLSENKIIHCDIKPENILISIDNDNNNQMKLNKINLIDFGSVIFYHEKGAINLATPEYMPPEVINLFINENNKNNNNNNNNNFQQSMIEQLMNQGHMDVIDVWSLGASLLEILTGLPQWLSYKCRVIYNKKSIVKTGLFTTRNQDYEKLYQKQKGITEQLPIYLNNILPMFDDQSQGEMFLELLSQMLKFNPAERIKPKDILKHPFINSSCSEEIIEQCKQNYKDIFEPKIILQNVTNQINNNNNNVNNQINNNDNIQQTMNYQKSSREQSMNYNKLNDYDSQNKLRSQSLLDGINSKQFYYQNKYKPKILNGNNNVIVQQRINLSQYDLQKEKNKSIISQIQDLKSRNNENSLFSPNLSMQDIGNNSNINNNNTIGQKSSLTNFLPYIA